MSNPTATPDATTNPAPAAATPIQISDATSTPPSSITSPVVVPPSSTTSSVAAQPLPAPGTPPPAISTPSAPGTGVPAPQAQPPHSNPKVASLAAIFPGFDPAVLESVLDSVNGDEERAADVLLSMSDPNYVSQVKAQPNQADLDEQLARRLMLEEQGPVGPRTHSWNPQQQGGVPYSGPQGFGPPQGQAPPGTYGQGGGVNEFKEQFDKFAETGKKTVMSLFSKAKAKFEEFEQSRNSGPGPSHQGQQQGWSGQNPTYYQPPPQTQQVSQQPPRTDAPSAPISAAFASRPAEPRTPSPSNTAPIPTPAASSASPAPAAALNAGTSPTANTGLSDSSASRIGLLPKRPVSLVGSTPKKRESEDDLGYVENPFEESSRHR